MGSDFHYNAKHAEVLRSVLVSRVTETTPGRRLTTWRPLIFVVAGVVAGSLFTGGAALALAGRPPSDAESKDPGALFPNYYDQLPRVGNDVAAAAALSPGVFVASWLDPGTRTLHVEYSTAANPADVRQFIEAVAAIPTGTPLTIQTEPVTYDAEHIGQLAQEISADESARWSAYFGSKVVGSHVEPKSGTIDVFVEAVPANPRTATPDGTPVRLEQGTSVTYDVGSGAPTSR